MVVIKVASKSEVKAVAGAIASSFAETDVLTVECVGAGAINQAIKAIATARGRLAPIGKDIVCIPSFKTITIGDEDKTGIALKCVLKD